MKLHVVPAASGLVWARLGIRTFLAQPLALSGLFFLFTAALGLVGAIPYLGDPLVLVLMPAATLGLMAGARDAADGKFPPPSTLLAGFRGGAAETHAMLILGVVYAAAVLLVVALPGLLGMPKPFEGSMNELMAMNPEAQAAALRNTLLHGLLKLALYTPVSMAFWHAPALAHWHQVPAVKSLFFSFVACLRNIRALALFSIYWAAITFAVTIPLSLLGALAGSMELSLMLVFPASLLLFAMFLTSIYFSYRDSFIHESPEQA